MTKIMLTPAQEARIVAAVQMGGYAPVAAEAAGLPARVFSRWMKEGRRNEASPHRPFYNKIQQGLAIARLKSEIETHQKNSRYWLTLGPGRETSSCPGWTSPAKPATRDWKNQDSLLASKSLSRMLGMVREGLTSYPDALETVIAMVEKGKRPANQKLG